MESGERNAKVQVKRASAGLGLFAAEELYKDQFIIEYTGDRITAEEANVRGGHYLFEVTEHLTIDGKGREHMARYINHSCAPNAEAEHDVDTDRIYIRACRQIEEGEEITMDYGEEFFHRMIGAKQCRCSKCTLLRETDDLL